jgi:hypothetical protein
LQFAFFVAGSLGFLPEFCETQEAWVELQQSNLATFVSDENGESCALDAALDQLAARSISSAEMTVPGHRASLRGAFKGKRKCQNPAFTSYMSLFVDIYMPDIKYSSNGKAQRFSDGWD